jgi:DNA-3-methyladenine glycosylase
MSHDVSWLVDLPPNEAAPRLLGWSIVTPEATCRIVEVEAYGGEDDPGSHAWRGPTPRTRTMYGPPGRAYVYFTYGNHWMLNVVARPEGQAAALLVRAAQPLTGLEAMRPRRPKAKSDRDLLAGPGRLTAALGLNGSHDGAGLLQGDPRIRLEPGPVVQRVIVGTRIGLSPGRGEMVPWRFVDAAGLEWCSRPRPQAQPDFSRY